MFGIAPDEMLLVVIVAIIVIGPKDLPLALRTAGRWIGTIRRVSGHFRTGIETMIREAEMEELERKWKEQNVGSIPAPPQLEGGSDQEAGRSVLPAPPAPSPEAAGVPSYARDLLIERIGDGSSATDGI